MVVTCQGWAKPLRVRGEVEDLANLADAHPPLRAADRWRTLRKFAPGLIEALEFAPGAPDTQCWLHCSYSPI